MLLQQCNRLWPSLEEGCQKARLGAWRACCIFLQSCIRKRMLLALSVLLFLLFLLPSPLAESVRDGADLLCLCVPRASL